METFTLLALMFNKIGLSLDFCTFNTVVDDEEGILEVYGLFAMDLTKEHLYLHLMGLDILEIIF